MDAVGDELVDERRHGARHGVEQRARRDEDFGGGEVAALDVAHRGGFVGGDEAELVEVVERPKVVEPLRKLGRRDFEKVLIQGTEATAPEFDFEAARPREKHIAVLHDVFGRQVGVAAVGSGGIAFAELGDLDDRQRGTVAGRMLLEREAVQVVRGLVEAADFPPLGDVPEGGVLEGVREQLVVSDKPLIPVPSPAGRGWPG